MKKEKLVSILIPCYNHEDYVADCLESILAQTYQNIEILICDDSSTDKSYSIIKEYESKLNERFHRVVIFRNESNQGIVKNLNHLIINSKGYYLKNFASDDILDPSAVEKMVEFYEQNPDYDVIYSNFMFINENEHYPIKRGKERRTNYNNNNLPLIGMNLSKKLFYGCGVAAPSAFIKKDTYDKFGLYDEKYYLEDWEYWLRVSSSGSFGYYDGITVYYRESSSSMSHLENSDYGRMKFRKITSSCEDILDKYKEYGSKDAWEIFYNNNVSSAFKINDLEYANTLRDHANKHGISLSFKNRVKFIIPPMILKAYFKVTRH